MKKYIIMASVAALAIGLSSCSNFLDELPDNRTELNENNVGKILLSAYPTTAICEMGEMSSDNTDAYPNRLGRLCRTRSGLSPCTLGILLYGNLCLQRGFESD